MNQKQHNLLYTGISGQEKIKTIEESGKLLFRFHDVVRVLAKDNQIISNINKQKESFKGLLSKFLNVVKEKERILVPLESANEFGQMEDFYITEPGLYRVVTVDESEAALRFQDWVFEDVLPSIRKYGSYPAPISSEASDLKNMVALLQTSVNTLALEIEKREELEKKVNSIEERVEAIESQPDNDLLQKFISINRFSLEHSLNEVKEDIWAWCEKIVLESGAESLRSPTNDKYDKQYPIYILKQVRSILKI